MSNSIPPRVVCGQRWLANNVVLRMIKDISNVGHVVIMDIFFQALDCSKNYCNNKTMQPGPCGLTILDSSTIGEVGMFLQIVLCCQGMVVTTLTMEA